MVSEHALRRLLAGIARTAAELCEASDALVYRVEGDRYRFVAHHGSIAAGEPIGATHPLSRRSPGAKALRTRRPVHVRDMAAAVVTRYPDIAAITRQVGGRGPASTLGTAGCGVPLSDAALFRGRVPGTRRRGGTSRLLGEIAARELPGDAAAADRFRQSLVVADALGMRPLVAHCHLGLGKLYRRGSPRQEAHEHLTTATTMYREMSMRFYLEQAEVELAALG